MVLAYKGKVENGTIQLQDDVQLPEHASVVVVLTEGEDYIPRLPSPRCADKNDLRLHAMLIEDVDDAHSV